jgi:predicted tellurium resistance membrane protein TerC
MQKVTLLGLLLATLYVEALILSNVSFLSLPWTALLVVNFFISSYCAIRLYGDKDVKKANK